MIPVRSFDLDGQRSSVMHHGVIHYTIGHRRASGIGGLGVGGVAQLVRAAES